MRVAPVVAVLAAATASPARADDLCARPHHGAAIDLDVVAADVHDTLRLLADAGHVNLVVADSVHGVVTVKLRRVAWDAAACAVAELAHLSIDVDGDILVVTARAAGSRTSRRSDR